MWSRESTEEEKKLFEKLEDLRRRGVPVDCSDPDCPPSEPGRKWHRGLPSFLQNKKTIKTQITEENRRDPVEV
jgi:hypothetical protein